MVEVVLIGNDLSRGQRQVPRDHDHGIEGGQALAEVTLTLMGCPGPWDVMGLRAHAKLRVWTSGRWSHPRKRLETGARIVVSQQRRVLQVVSRLLISLKGYNGSNI